MIAVRGLTKSYGRVQAVEDLSFDVPAGAVTGFLGPNGAGKSTTMRIVMGLDRAGAGSALVDGEEYARMDAPLRRVGALLDADALHPGRTGRAHLRVAARTHGIPLTRVDEVLDQVGLGAAGRRRVRGYSLGMRQRLGIAAALLGDPPVVLFDEPVNGLDLDGVRWVRTLLRGFAVEGRTVLVSSHLMSEVELVADRVVVIGRGRLVAETSTSALLRDAGAGRVRVRTPSAADLVASLPTSATVERTGAEELVVTGLSAAEVGDLARSRGLALHHLSEVERSLEHAYLRLTADDVEYAGGAAAPAAGASA